MSTTMKLWHHEACIHHWGTLFNWE